MKGKPGATPEPDEKPAVAPHGKLSCQPADVEVVVFGPGGVQVYRNDIDESGKRTLVVVEQSAELESVRNVLAGVLADIDHDGDLDLILSTASGISIWLNAGQLKFDDATNRSALPPAELAATSLVVVPLSAISNRPLRLYIAPVNAPFSCPNNSLSSRLSVRAPQ